MAIRRETLITLVVMCSDPNSPEPRAFCCMRGMSITVIVFAVFNILGALNSLGPMTSGEPCYICTQKGGSNARPRLRPSSGYWIPAEG